LLSSSINRNIEQIKLKLKTIPETPGVYQHLDASGKVIYVGKARNLQRRVSSYFTNYDEKSAKIKMLVRNIADIRVTVVATEVDALLLENNLIKQYQPRYNSLLKDDKTYPYLCLTDEDYPRLVLTRDRSRLRGQFFGPYPNGRILRELQEIIRSLFCYRTCSKPLRYDNIDTGTRPCIKHQIGLCKAPCAALESREQYLATIENIRRILKGDFGDILDGMKRQMFDYADQLQFEEAERMKQRIRLLEEYQSRSTVVNTTIADLDVYCIESDDRHAWVNIMRVKKGSIIYSYSTEIKKQLDESDAEILATVIPALHEQTESTAREMVVPIQIDEIPDDYMRQTIPTKGDRKKLLELSERNIKAYRHQCAHQRMLVNPEAAMSGLLERIQRELHLPQLPVNIECFDNSNIQGAFPVAAMVRFTNGKPNRSEYRKFNIKTVEGPDDYASMAEVIYRRYKRLSDEGKELPQLLIVDGGRGQMEVARDVIANQLRLGIPIAGLAKDDKHHTSELLCYDGNDEIRTVQIKPSDQLFHLLERIQNEVHRFAITFHKDKRSKGTIKTSLTDIPGIGPKTAQDLLLKFGSLKQIKLQTLDDLTQAVGAAKARIVYERMHEG
jgi:excinuclease ABC subunit C